MVERVVTCIDKEIELYNKNISEVTEAEFENYAKSDWAGYLSECFANSITYKVRLDKATTKGEERKKVNKAVSAVIGIPSIGIGGIGTSLGFRLASWWSNRATDDDIVTVKTKT